jgi:hypothetical protein
VAGTQQPRQYHHHRPELPHSRRKDLSDMSASQIPNLNTLRRGGGRGRLRGRGGFGTGTPGEERHGSRGIAAQDRVVQGTDNDASVSRLSAVEIGYLEDPFARALTPPGSETRRLPIINRGNPSTMQSLYLCCRSDMKLHNRHLRPHHRHRPTRCAILGRPFKDEKADHLTRRRI